MEQHRSMAMISVLLLMDPLMPRVMPGPLAAPVPQAQQDAEHFNATGRIAELLGQIGMVRRSGSRQQPEAEPPGEPLRITLRPTTLASAVDELAGQRVRILNARVVGMFEPRAFLIESATSYEATMGLRDRVLVLIDGTGLQAAPEHLVGSTVVILGVARTLLGLRLSPELPWPPKLDRDLIERLEVRAAVLATSVQTPEGTELTERSPIDPKRLDHSPLPE
jgi:hypothetical protein